MPNGSDETFVEKLSKQLKDREHYVKPRIRASEGFIIKHYATDVCYSALGYVLCLFRAAPLKPCLDFF